MLAHTDLLDALPAAVYTTDADGNITFYNQAAADLWGRRPELGTAQWCGSWRLYWPDGRPLPHDECPMAVALKEGRPVRGVEAVAERPDGSRVPFLPFPTPLKDASGRITGAVNLLVDLTERKVAGIESALLAAIVASSDDAIISKTLDGRITSWNAGATEIFGYQASEMIGQSITRIIPAELRDEEKLILARLRQGEHIQHYETVRIARDGRRVDVSLSVSPLRDPSGEVTGASKVARDITERKQAERSQFLLVEELNHRVKNTLAMVQAIANLSSRRAKGLSEFLSSFTGRVQALAKAHDLLVHTRMEGAEVKDIVREQVLLGEAGDDRISCSGPVLMVDAQSAVHLAMILHELATNARKYGALSVPNGRLSISWSMRTDTERALFVEWAERGVPEVNAPTGGGFGTTLIEQLLRGRGGEACMRYDAGGVTGEIRVPLPAPERTDAGGRAAASSNRVGLSVVQHQVDKRSLRGKRVLVVEDEALISMELAASLTAAGCEVIGPAGTLEHAKRLITDSACDAALVDANLAGHPVDELAIALTQRNVPFAFVTGYGRDVLPHGFREAIVLAKPFSQDQLLAAVQAILGSPGVIPLRRKAN